MSGFVYLWFDKKHHRYYIGSHWGSEDDGYVCSSHWMRTSYKRRPEDFKRRIIARVNTTRKDLLIEEHRWLSMIRDNEIKPHNPNPRYYNLMKRADHLWHANDSKRKDIGKRISEAKKAKNLKIQFSDPEARRRKISETKKRKFQEKRDAGEPTRTPEQIERWKESRQGHRHSDEWKVAQSERLKKQWAEGGPRRK